MPFGLIVAGSVFDADKYVQKIFAISANISS